MIQHGTRPVRRDHRRYSLNRTFGSSLPTQFPDEYNVDAGFGLPDQNAEGYPEGCTGYTQSELCQDQDRGRYSPQFTYDKTRMMEGTSGQSVGCSIEDSLKSTIVYGVEAPGGTDEQATWHRRGAYYQVEPVGTDFFTAIQQALYLNSAEKRAVSCGTPWFSEWSMAPQGILHDFVFRGDEPWHNWKICGWKQIGGQTYLIGKTWQGTAYGDAGWCYLSRTVCNRVFALSGTGAFTVRKETAADIQTVKLNIFDAILSYARMWLLNLRSQALQPRSTPFHAPQPESAPPEPPPLPTVPPTVPQSESAPVDPDSFLLDWSTQKGAWQNVRVLADKAGLTLEQKNIVCACIYQESEFLNTAQHANENAHGDVTSTDYGICQINDYFHIGPGKDFPSVAYVLANPQDAVEFMIDMYKAGKLSLWSSYSLGAYKRWLSPTSRMWALAD